MTNPKLSPDEIRLLDDIRRVIRATPYERITDQEAERAYAGLPAAAHSNAIEDNPLTPLEYAFQLLLIEERVPAEGTSNLTLEFMRREERIATRPPV